MLETYLYPDEHKIVIVVPDDQLSLAIGKGGVNARLAARLVGWKLTIYGEEQYKASMTPIEKLDILTKEQLEVLKKFEIDTVQKLARMKEELLRSIPEIGDKANEILLAARKLVDQVEAEHAFVTKDRQLEEALSAKKQKDVPSAERQVEAKTSEENPKKK